jgi:hypothetical protein
MDWGGYVAGGACATHQPVGPKPEIPHKTTPPPEYTGAQIGQTTNTLARLAHALFDQGHDVSDVVGGYYAHSSVDVKSRNLEGLVQPDLQHRHVALEV